MSTHQGSAIWHLQQMEVGASRYVDVPDGMPLTNAMHIVLPHRSRWPAEMREREYITEAYTAVRAGRVGVTKVLVCVTRTA